MKDLVLFIIIHALSLIFLIYFLYKKNKQLNKRFFSDLYLIYQLNEPYQPGKIISKTLKLEYFIKEFYRFKFKKKEFYIGGDSIYYTNIFLKNRKYIFFINADCMGKSLQGFGGTIVLNSILSTMLLRTVKRQIEKERYPETWLKYIAYEIQEIFESFNGFMMLSAVMGLIDEENGFIYFLNFDHPPPILFSAREKKYKFINYRNYSKLGFPKKNFYIEIERMYLEKGDSLYISSDGKDEISIKDSINYNENLALKLLKDSEGNLETFYNKISKVGKIRDDFSILKITGTEDFQNQIHLNPQIKNKNLKNPEYILYLKKISEEFPYDENLMYSYSSYLRRKRLYQESAEISERIHNFNKNSLRNIRNLFYCYNQLNNHYRIQTLLEEIKVTAHIEKMNKFFKKISLSI